MMFCNAETGLFSSWVYFWACFADLPLGGLKKHMKNSLSGRMDIALSRLFHGRLSAFGTQADVKFPDCL
jgi:hypothetical protein